MPVPQAVPLGLGSYQSASQPFSAQRCINMYAVVAQGHSLSDFQLYHTPGSVNFATAGLTGSRGTAVMAGVYYVITGTSLYSIDSVGTETNLGTILGTDRVVTAHNGTKLCIVVPGGNSYVWDSSTMTLTQITSGNFRTSDSVCFKDGYFIFTESGTNVFFNSALNDPLTFDALDFGTAELSPGPIIGCHASYDEVFVLKRNVTEVYQNVGGTGFPFQRISGASFEKGTHSRYTPVQWEGAFYFVGGGTNEKASVYVAKAGADPLKISTDAIDKEIQRFTETEIGGAFSLAYAIDGSSFVGFTFRSINVSPRTFVYNVTASRLSGKPVWFEQQTGTTGDNAWRVNSVDFVYDRILVSDAIDGRIGYLDTGIYTEYGNEILKSKTTGPLVAGGVQMLVHSLELTIDAGPGIISGPGSDPQVMMDYSDDGARTWSSEIWRAAMGGVGEYFRRTVWRRLGRVPAHRVWRFGVTDPVKTVFHKLEARVTYGS